MSYFLWIGFATSIGFIAFSASKKKFDIGGVVGLATCSYFLFN